MERRTSSAVGEPGTRWLWLFLVVFSLGALLAGCGRGHTGKSAPGANGFVLRDDLGRTLHFDHLPQRIVSLAPSITETVYALDGQARLVGVTTFCDYPPQAREKPRVGDFSNPNLERIVALKPEVVLLASLEQAPLLARLEAAGLTTFVIQPEHVDGILSSIRTVGTLLGEKRWASVLADSLREMLDSIRTVVRNVPVQERPRIFVEIADRPLMTAGPNTFVGELIEAAGGRNIATGLPRAYSVINPERVIKENPQIMILADAPIRKEDVVRRPGWKDIDAVRDGRVYDDIDPDLLVRPGPRALQGLRELHRRFYPPGESPLRPVSKSGGRR
jgi:iron complex transport system substrate-binding protein